MRGDMDILFLLQSWEEWYCVAPNDSSLRASETAHVRKKPRRTLPLVDKNHEIHLYVSAGKGQTYELA